MKEKKFTPGPWKKGRAYMAIVADNPTGFDDQKTVDSYGGSLVCESVKLDANAHLIAAAPDMYDVLEFISESNMSNVSDLKQVARAALAKARGDKL